MKKFKIVYQLSVIVTLICLNLIGLYSQTEGDIFTDFASYRTITPNAPTTASLGLFGDYPVNFVYGLPNISIPLIQFSSGDIVQNLELNYHADGIKVRERASWVGLGWSLFAGGVITANVNGYPDLYGYFDNVDIIPSMRERVSRLLGTTSQVDSLLLGMNMADCIISGECDFDSPDHAPDVYNIIAADISGSFIFNSFWKPEKIDETLPLKIVDICWDSTFTYANGQYTVDRRLAIWGFKVIDQDGNTYIFGGLDNESYNNYVEKTTSWPEYSIDLQYEHPYVSAWYLNKIVSPDRADSIEFFYETDVSIHDIIPSFYIKRSRYDNLEYKTFNNIQTNTIKLKRILFKNGKIEFSRSIYLQGEDSQLNTIILSQADIFAADGYKAIKSISFEYNVFNNLDGSSSLKLSEVNINDEDDLSCQRYSFGYNTLQLPGRNSNDLDHWGYYNGANNPGTSEMIYSGDLGLIPQITTELQGYSSITEGVGNRDPNDNYTAACCLQKVFYPTGGYTSFEFENHKIGLNTQGGLRIRRILNYDNINALTPSKIREYSYSGGYLLGHRPTEYSYLRKFFTDIDCDTNYTSPYEVAIFNSGAKGIYQTQSTTAYTQVTERRLDQNGDDLGKTLYKYYGQPDISSVYSTTSSFNSFFTPYQSYSSIREKLKNILHYDSNDSLVSETEYYYENTIPNTGVGFSMGFVVERNDFYSLNSWNPFFHSCAFKIRNYNSNYFLANYQIYKLRYQLIHSIEKKYFASNSVIDTTKYAYNNIGTGGNYTDVSCHPYPVKIEKRNSSGDKITIFNRYPLDYYIPSSSAPSFTQLSELKGKHVISPVINRSILVNDVLSNSTIIEYEGLFPKTIHSFCSVDKIEVPSYFDSNVPIQIIPTELSAYMKPKIHFTYINNKLTTQQKENDIPVSFIWGYNGQKRIAEVKNANSNEIFYTSFEDEPYIYEWNGEYEFDDSTSITGKMSLWTKPEDTSQDYYYTERITPTIDETKKFKYSAWVFSTGPTADVFLMWDNDITNNYGYNGYSVKTVRTRNEWVYVEGEASVPAGTKELFVRLDNNSQGNVWFDDVKFYPADAQMTTYTHDPLIGVTSQTDPNGKITHYEYDSFGRLWRILNQNKKILKQYDYHYINE